MSLINPIAGMWLEGAVEQLPELELLDLFSRLSTFGERYKCPEKRSWVWLRVQPGLGRAVPGRQAAMGTQQLATDSKTEPDSKQTVLSRVLLTEEETFVCRRPVRPSQPHGMLRSVLLQDRRHFHTRVLLSNSPPHSAHGRSSQWFLTWAGCRMAPPL